MHEPTRRALLELSQRFYDESAESFDATRQRPWPGWSRLLPLLQGRGPLRVLDAGCGNARFGLFLAEQLRRPLHYHGVDASEGLLRHAANALPAALADRGSSYRLENAELTAWAAESAGLEGYDLVVLFGVLHHLPSRPSRRRLLEGLLALLRPGGYLVPTWWMLHRTPRISKKRVPWTLAPEIDVSRLESGDTLISWQSGGAPRYVHFPTPDELEDLLDLKSAHCAESFSSDGPSGQDNLYRVYRREKSC